MAVQRNQHGFTLIEALVVMGMITVLAGVSMVALISPQRQANQTSPLDALLTDIRGQQLKAMIGGTESGTTATLHGVYMPDGSSTYTLFKGVTYSGADTDNFVVDMPSGITISTTFPSDQMVFTRLSGDVVSWVNGTNTITITNTVGNTSNTITVNRYGALTVN